MDTSTSLWLDIQSKNLELYNVGNDLYICNVAPSNVCVAEVESGGVQLAKMQRPRSDLFPFQGYVVRNIRGSTEPVRIVTTASDGSQRTHFANPAAAQMKGNALRKSAKYLEATLGRYSVVEKQETDETAAKAADPNTETDEAVATPLDANPGTGTPETSPVRNINDGPTSTRAPARAGARAARSARSSGRSWRRRSSAGGAAASPPGPRPLLRAPRGHRAPAQG